MQYDSSVIGPVIRQQRKLRNMSQEVLSGLAGIARTHLTMIENGSKQANLETLWKIALALDMRPCKLVEEIEIYMLSNRDQKHG